MRPSRPQRRRLRPRTTKLRHPDQPRRQDLANGICPKCLHELWTRNRHCSFICKCGWLLRVEPVDLNRVDGKPTIILDAVIDTGGGMRHGVEFPGRSELVADGMRRLIRYWTEHDILKVVDLGNGKVDLVWPTHTDYEVDLATPLPVVRRPDEEPEDAA